MLEKTADIFIVGEAENGNGAQRLLPARGTSTPHQSAGPGDDWIHPYAFEKWARENYPETITRC
jgi:hypothetical protein